MLRNSNKEIKRALSYMSLGALLSRKCRMSVTSGTPSLANTVCINRSASTASQSPNRGAFAATGNSANECADSRATRGRQFIPMFLPKASPMFVAIADATGVRMTNLAVTVPEPAAGFARCGRCQKQQHHQHQ
jgi:hypothetical protein